MTILTFAVGQPGAIATWVQAEAAPIVPAGTVAIAYTPEDGKPLPQVAISADGASVAPASSLDLAKAARWADALAYRNGRQEGGCATPLGRVDTDPDSQRKINGAATAAMIAQVTEQPFPAIGWTMADNSVVSHDATAIITMGMTVIAYLNSCQQAGTAIRASINAASDADALAAIDITAGYPA